MHAVIENNIVTDTLRVNPYNIYPEAYASRFVECPEGVRRGWLFDGVKYSAPPPAPATAPRTVTMRQARLALLAAGLLNTVETAIAGAGPAAKIEWEYAQDVQRAAGLIPAMATALGLTDAQIDALFVAAAAL